jgi:hypothetical protein
MSNDPNWLPTSKQAGHVLTIMDQRGVSRDALAAVTNNGMLADFFEAAAAGIKRSRDELRMFYGLLPIEFPTPVDHEISIDNLYMNGNFRVGSGLSEILVTYDTKPWKKGVIDTTFVLVRVTTKFEHDAIGLRRQLRRDKLRPADGRELLTFGIKWPQAMKNAIVVALCPEHRKGTNLRLTGVTGGDGIAAYDCSDYDIAAYCHILAVRESTVAIGG